ncbi:MULTISPECIES: Ger(x)C family spore germination protein [Paenibacillus]|uniref:Spore germination protein KC n=1 Tax=Paenibacillus cineris TaxID=237530 RepID=A0ABQ4LAH5_9BACL|nr:MULTISPECIES: Ger(x)C family spore germination protein [Paenibacillus]MCM2997662.1 Ger(x)C family spore germination protein [Paenibacillus cellulositrophicus]GIO53455.1 spore germination protein KC [Paenibacillus cineris]
MKRTVLSIVCCALLLLLPGCWNSKDIQNMAYVTAIGLDYVDGKYKSYIQVLNFSNVAQSQNAQVGKVVPIWIGTGEGKTVTESLTSIYSTAQRRVFWGHMKAVVCSERLLKHGMDQVFDMLNRFREIRYNVLLYGTRDPIQDILTEKSILNFSPLESVLESPQQIYTQRSFILPIYEFKILAQLREPSGTAILPSLTIDYKDWYEDKKDHPMHRVSGAYFFDNRELRGWLSEDDLRGTRWIQRQLERSPVNIPIGQTPVATLILMKPHFVVEPKLENDKIHFNIRIGLKSYVDLLIKDTPESTLEKMAAELVKKEVIESYKKGVALKSDVLMLEDKLYRKYPGKWRELSKQSDFILTEDMLKNVDVTITMVNSGKYKQRVH